MWLILATLLLLILAQYFWQQRKFYYVSNQLPGSKGLPFLGGALDFYGVSNAEIVNIIKNKVNKYSSPFQFWLGPKLFVVTDNPDDAQILLNSPNAHRKGETYNLIKEMMHTVSDGLISSHGDVWRYHRKLLNPCFSANTLDSYVLIFNRSAKVLINILEKQADNGVAFDIEKNIRPCTFDMIVDTSLGVQLNSQLNNDVGFSVAADEYMHVMTTRFFNFFLHPKLIFQRTKYYPIVKNAAMVMTVFCRNVLTKLLSEGTHRTNHEQDTLKSFINQLIKISRTAETFNDDDVIAETITAVLAGHDTTASAISNTILLLAMHPKIQDKVFAELKGILPDQESDTTHENIHEMVYLKQVIKESLRLLVITPVFSRLLTSDVVLSNGVKLPEGCQIAIPVLTLHRRTDIWGDDADKFNPENFAPYVKRHPYGYLPFSGGSRICIGYKYANMAMVTVLAHLIRNYKFSTHLKLDELSFDFCITLRLINKHMVKIEKRLE